MDAETRSGPGPGLQAYIDQVRAIQRDARELVAGLTEEQANRPPVPGRWSVLQCLDHVTRTLEQYLGPMERMIAEAAAREAAGKPPFREGWFTRWFVRDMEPPVRLKLSAPRRVRPAPTLSVQPVLEQFTAAHDRLIDVAVRAGGVSLRHARMSSPFARWVRLTLGQALAVNAAHARRHLWQARRVRADAL